MVEPNIILIFNKVINHLILLVMKLKNEDTKIGKLGKENTFVSGTKNWRIEWAEISGERFSVGDKVSFFDEDDQETFVGNIDWMIVTESGEVEVSIAKTPLGRIDLELIKHVK